jgi:DNA-binding CsgD family transcriptional regulator
VAWWKNEVDESIRLAQRAHAAYKREGRPGPAAMVAVWIGAQYMAVHGNQAAAEGWFAVARRLLLEAGHCREMARVLVWGSLIESDLNVARDACAQATELARMFNDRDCELFAEAYLGLAMVSQGEVREGIRRLDETMALCTAGEVEELDVIGHIYCAMLLACERSADFARAEQWCRVGGFVQRYRECVFSAACRACYGAILTARGHWSQADEELLASLKTFEAGPRQQRIDALGRLAYLRVLQGRTAEAATLLEGLEEHPDAALPIAALELAAGTASQAAARLVRRLASLGQPNTQAGPLLSLLVEALLSGGETAEARAAATRLQELASVTGSGYLVGLAALAAGGVTAAEGGDPVPELEVALDRLVRAEMPLEAARARLAIAREQERLKPELAAAEARLALATFERLGAAPDGDNAAALLRRLGVGGRGGPRRRGPRTVAGADHPLSAREVEIAELVAQGLSNSEIARRLFISKRTAETHVDHIKNKMGFTTRAQLVAWVLGRGRGG